MNIKNILDGIRQSDHRYNDALGQIYERIRGKDRKPGFDSSCDVEKLLRKHWNKEAVIMEGRDIRGGIDGHETLREEMLAEKSTRPRMCEISKEELLAGELSAFTFQVGCYTVRSAQRVYQECMPGFVSESDVPADLTQHEDIRSAYDEKYGVRMPGVSLTTGINDFSSLAFAKGLRPAHEISVRHNLASNGQFICVCRASQSSGVAWAEMILCVCAAKENAGIPDEYASLFVCSEFCGSSHSSVTWYKIAPYGGITSLSPGAYGIMEDDAKFQ